MVYVSNALTKATGLVKPIYQKSGMHLSSAMGITYTSGTTKYLFRLALGHPDKEESWKTSLADNVSFDALKKAAKATLLHQAFPLKTLGYGHELCSSLLRTYDELTVQAAQLMAVYDEPECIQQLRPALLSARVTLVESVALEAL